MGVVSFDPFDNGDGVLPHHQSTGAGDVYRRMEAQLGRDLDQEDGLLKRVIEHFKRESATPLDLIEPIDFSK